MAGEACPPVGLWAPIEPSRSPLGSYSLLPTNYLGYVVEWSIGKYNDIRWVYLAEVLRIRRSFAAAMRAPPAHRST